MSDVDPTPDDLLVSAVLDGEASPAEVEQVASDPRLAARLERLRVVARAVGGPVPLVDPRVREAHLAAALAEARRLTPPATASAPAPAPAPPPPPPPVDLAAARARRRPVGTVILSVAAALVLVAAVAAGLARVARESGSGDDTAASTAEESREAADSAATDGGGDAALPEAQGDSSSLGEGGQAPSTTAPGSASAGAEGEIDPSLPDLGTFTKSGDLAAAVRGRLVLDPRPAPAGDDPVCQGDFPVPTTLLGRATVEGEEGLVYVEAAPGSGRRLWFVDPSTPGADGDACRQVVPVQQL